MQMVCMKMRAVISNVRINHTQKKSILFPGAKIRYLTETSNDKSNEGVALQEFPF